jgi:beta-lactamase class A
MLKRACTAEEKRIDATIGVCTIDLATGACDGWRDDESFPTASCIKVPILAALFERAKRDKLDLDTKVRMRKGDKVGGSGVLRHMTPGTEFTLRDLGMLMTIVSDNAATNMLIDYLGLKAINASIQSWDMKRTVLWRKIDFTKSTKKKKWLGESSPGDMANLLARIGRRELLGKKHDAEMEEMLAAQKYDTAIPRYLPNSGNWSDDDPEIVVAHKTGSITGVRVDAGIVTAPFGRYVVSAFVKDLEDNRYHSDNPGVLAIGRVARKVHDAMEKSAKAK